MSVQILFESAFLNDFCENNFFKVCSEHESHHLFMLFFQVKDTAFRIAPNWPLVLNNQDSGASSAELEITARITI